MDDLDYIVGLMRTETDAVGFIPSTAIANYWLRRGQYIIPRSRHGPRRGYLLHGPTKPHKLLRVHQVLIDYDWRRRAHATAAVRQLIARARRAGAPTIQLRCAADLDANAFWLAMGFTPTGIQNPPNRRSRAIITYRLDLTARHIAPAARSRILGRGVSLAAPTPKPPSTGPSRLPSLPTSPPAQPLPPSRRKTREDGEEETADSAEALQASAEGERV